MSTNYYRLNKLAEEVFAVKNDPEQLDVDDSVIRHLVKIHPYTVSEHIENNESVAWLLVIPTTEEIMNDFISGKITEKQLYQMTPLNTEYQTIYLCSALVLEEFRSKGITKEMAIRAIQKIQKDHPVKALFTWPFTDEGDKVAEKISDITGLPLYKRTDRH